VIADILMIKHSTVRFHIKNIFHKLEVNERTLAVVKAIKLGLITPTSADALWASKAQL
jgi:DNA-binding CsgD family transcriptional regulator